MVRKVLAGAAIVAGSFALGSPAMAAQSTGEEFGGVYPTIEEANAACDAGIAQGRWYSCSFETVDDPNEPIRMWVYV